MCKASLMLGTQYPCSRAALTCREHGCQTRVSLWTPMFASRVHGRRSTLPVFTAVHRHLLTTREHRPCSRCSEHPCQQAVLANNIARQCLLPARSVDTGALYTLPLFMARKHGCHFWTPVNTSRRERRAVIDNDVIIIIYLQNAWDDGTGYQHGP